MPHDYDYPYPAEFPAGAAKIIVDFLRGRDEHPICCVAHAAWALQGYTMLFTIGSPDDAHPQPIGAAAPSKPTEKEAADRLEALIEQHKSDTPKAVGGFMQDWLIRMLLEVVQRLLERV